MARRRKTGSTPLNKAQLILCETYGGGDYNERWSTYEEFFNEWAEDPANIGDGLFSFLMIELTEATEGSTGTSLLEAAADAVDRAGRDVEEVRAALEAATMDPPEADPDDEDYDDNGNLKPGYGYND